MTSSKYNLIGKVALGTLIAVLCSCSSAPVPDQPMAEKAEKPFAAAGSVEMQLDGGDYVIRSASDDHIRIALGGNTGNATTEIGTTGTHANLSVKNTPNKNFRAVIQVPMTTDLVIRLSGGNLGMSGVTGNKDIDSKAGNVELSVGNPNDYASVDASVKVGNLDAGPFGKSDSGIGNHFTWSGGGKYKLIVNLGAGNLQLKN